MYKITCNRVDFLSRSSNNKYRGVEFNGIGYTDDEEVAEEFRRLDYHHGGVPIFNVEEVAEDQD